MDEPKSWDQLPGEPDAWYLRFKRFCRKGPGRTVLGLFNAERAEKGLKKALRITGAWDVRLEQFRWKERAAAFDHHIEKKEEREWEALRLKYRKREVDLAEQLIKKSEQMLQFPVARTKQESADGKTITIIEPADWRFRDVAATVETADKLYRLALAMETEHTTADVTVTDDIEKIRQKRWESILPQLKEVLADDLNKPDADEESL